MQRKTLLLVCLALPMVIAVSCAFKSGVITTDGGATSKSFGPVGKDERFEWDDAAVIDHHTNLTWQRHTNRTATWQDAQTACAAWGGRLPTRDELLNMSDFFGSSDLFDGPESIEGEHAVGWQWSQTSGSRDGTAWAVGGSSYANANDTRTVAIVRCVRAL